MKKKLNRDEEDAIVKHFEHAVRNNEGRSKIKLSRGRLKEIIIEELKLMEMSEATGGYGDKISAPGNRGGYDWTGNHDRTPPVYFGAPAAAGGGPGNRDDLDLTSGDRADIIVGLVNEISSHMLAMKTGELKEFKDLLQPMIDEISDHAHEIAASEVDI